MILQSGRGRYQGQGVVVCGVSLDGMDFANPADSSSIFSFLPSVTYVTGAFMPVRA